MLEEMLEKLKKLNKDKLHNIIFELMLADKIDYTELSKIYVFYLQAKKQEQWINIQGLATMLSYFIPFNNYKKDKFIEAKSAYHLFKSKVFRTAPIEKKYKEIIKKTAYSEDENGTPMKHIK